METNTRDNKHLFKRGRNDNGREGVGFALLLIIAGGLFLFLNLGIIPIVYRPILISWQMLLILIGIWLLIKRNYPGAITLLAVGFFFLYPRICRFFPDNFMCFDFSMRIYWPVLLIILGVLFIVRNPFTRGRHYEWKNNSSDNPDEIEIRRNGSEAKSSDFIDKSLMFGSSEQIVLSQNFRGGEGSVMFGELTIDLRKARLAEGINKLEANVMFGSIVVYVPSDWSVEIQSTTVFGSIEDKRCVTSEYQFKTAPTLIIKASAMFGGGEIRS